MLDLIAELIVSSLEWTGEKNELDFGLYRAMHLTLRGVPLVSVKSVRKKAQPEANVDNGRNNGTTVAVYESRERRTPLVPPTKSRIDVPVIITRGQWPYIPASTRAMRNWHVMLYDLNISLQMVSEVI